MVETTPPAGSATDRNHLETGTAAWGWLAHVPIPLFAVVMGLGGLGLAWRKAHEVLAVPSTIADAVLLLAAVCFAAVSVLYTVKAIRYWPEVLADFEHPVRIAFFPTIPISLLIFAIALLPVHTGASLTMWTTGAVVLLALALVAVNRWITHTYEIKQANPAWFIPVVGTILVPVAGVRLGLPEVSWLFFGIGCVFWLVLFALVLNRIIFHGQLPARFLPTLFILLAPPAVGYVAYLQLNGGIQDGFARGLFACALFTALLLASMGRLFLNVPFFLSWWAYTFPAAAFAIATLLYHDHIGTTATAVLATGTLLIATAIIAVVAARTGAALRRGQVFIPE